MSKKHVFGRAVTIEFQPMVDGSPVMPYELISARIYSDEPTEAQIDNTASGEIEEVTTWTAESGYRAITFAALTDAEPHSATFYEEYFVVVNYRFESGGPAVFDVETLFVYRPDAAVSRVSVSVADVLRHQYKLQDILPSHESMIADSIAEALKDIERELVGRGLEKRKIFNREELNDAVKYKALELACLNAGSFGDGDFWFTLAGQYKAKSEKALGLTKISYDVAGDDKPAPDAVNKGLAVTFGLR